MCLTLVCHDGTLCSLCRSTENVFDGHALKSPYYTPREQIPGVPKMWLYIFMLKKHVDHRGKFEKDSQKRPVFRWHYRVTTSLQTCLWCLWTMIEVLEEKKNATNQRHSSRIAATCRDIRDISYIWHQKNMLLYHHLIHKIVWKVSHNVFRTSWLSHSVISPKVFLASQQERC